MKNILITGAANGIGLEIAKIFLKDKVNLFLIDKNIDELKKKKNFDNSKKKANLKIIECDIGSFSKLSKLEKNDLKNVNRIDVLINNAGVDSFQRFENVNEKTFDYLNNINGKGSFFLTQKLFSKLKKSKSASIIFVSSLNALIGNTNHSAYTYSKGGIISLTRALAVELGKYNIRVNSVCPGSIKTKMLDRAIKTGLEKPINQLKKLYPLKRVGDPDEVAELVYFLSGDKSRFITGTIIPIDGGLSAK